MVKRNKYDDLEKVVMEGLRMTVKKLVEESIRNNSPLVVSIEGKIQKIYPVKAS